MVKGDVLLTADSVPSDPFENRLWSSSPQSSKKEKMPRYKITTDTNLDEYFSSDKRTRNEKYFGDTNVPSAGYYNIPKARTDQQREKHHEIDEKIEKHVSLSERPWYKSTIESKNLCMADPEMNADRVKESIVPRKSRVKHRDYEVPNYEPKSTYKKSLYGFGKSDGKSIEESLAEVREEKAAAKKAYNDRLRKEWMVEAPKCHLQSAPSGGDASLYSVADYLVLQEAEEREMEDMMEQMSTYKPFKTRKQIRWEKFGVDEDADEELLTRINIPRRKDHEKGTDLEELTDRHKSLVTDVLDRRSEKIARAKASVQVDSDEELLVDVKSEKWLSQGSTSEMPRGKYRSAQKSALKLDTLEDLLNYNPYGSDPITSTDDDFAELNMLKPKTYKSMESDDFMKSKYKHMYAPIKSVEEYDTQKLMKEVAYLTASCAQPEVDSD